MTRDPATPIMHVPGDHPITFKPLLCWGISESCTGAIFPRSACTIHVWAIVFGYQPAVYNCVACSREQRIRIASMSSGNSCPRTHVLCRVPLLPFAFSRSFYRRLQELLNTVWSFVVSSGTVHIEDEQIVKDESLPSKGIRSYEPDKPIEHGKRCLFSFRVSSRAEPLFG